MPRSPSTRAHSMPAGPAPTTSTSCSALDARVNRSGCQPRRYSSPEVAFCVQTIDGPPASNRDTQTLQPMHSRMSSTRPSAIFRGRNGSAIEGRAAPTMSNTPPSIARTIASGSVSRPQPTTGLAVTCFTALIHSNWRAGSKNRDGVASSPQSCPPTYTSHRSTSSSHARTNGSTSRCKLHPLRAPQAVGRQANRQRAIAADGIPHAFDDLPPDARAPLERPAVLVRALVVERRQELLEQALVPTVDADDVEARVARPNGGIDEERLHQARCRRDPSPGRARSGTRRSRSATARAKRTRDSRFCGCTPPYQSSTPASAPCSCTPSHIAPGWRHRRHPRAEPAT